MTGVVAPVAAAVAAYMAASLIFRPGEGRRPLEDTVGPRLRRLVRRQQEWLTQAGYAWTPTRFWVACTVLAFAGFAVAFVFTGGAAVAMPWALLGAAVLPWAFGIQRRKRANRFKEVWPDGVLNLLASLRSGDSPREAVIKLARTGPPLLRDAFHRYPDLQVTHATEALEVIKAEIADATTDRVVEVLLLAMASGDRTLAVNFLEDLLDTLQDEIDEARKIEAANTEAKITAAFVVVFPPLMLAFVSTWNELYSEYWSTAAGVRTIVYLTIWILAGRWVLSRFQRTYLERRVLTGGRR
ncbi:MAG: hypothetical protein IT198_14110 [Acidimicrobiia bacterium]|nr:hypothetical protein [Acidimicrobiia bacterium]